MKQYRAITRTLQGNEQLSLELYFHDMDAGVRNKRVASIHEPNPDKGKLAGDGDQTYVLGDRREKRWFSFRGRSITEALDLLDRVCDGETKVESTVSYMQRHGECTNGYEQPMTGVDMWMYTHFYMEIQRHNGLLVATLGCRDFDAYKGIIVTKRDVETVGDGIAPYEEYPQEIATLRHIYKGALLKDCSPGT